LYLLQQDPAVRHDEIIARSASDTEGNVLQLHERATDTVFEMPAEGQPIWRTIHVAGVAITVAFKLVKGYIQAKISSGPSVCEVVRMGVNIAGGLNPTVQWTLVNYYENTGLKASPGDVVTVSNQETCPA
jgi:phosphoribosylanthranilate isomerase